MYITTLVNILSKLRYFHGRNDIQIGYKSYQYFCFPERPMKGDLERGEILEKEGMTPLTNLLQYGEKVEHYKTKKIIFIYKSE